MSITAERSAVERSREAILEEIGDPPDLTVVRVGGDLGDDLIWAGTSALLADRIYTETDLGGLCAASGHTVLLSGSGAFCRSYHELMPRALAVAELRFERVLVLPSSFDPSEDEVREALARTGATVFARERESYARIRSLCDARLAHDCSFLFDFSPYARAGEGTLNAFRTDREAAGTMPPPFGNVDISSTASSLEEWLATIAAHELIRTDRAHVMIAAALMGKQVEFAPGPYHKVGGIAEYALAGYPVRPIAEPTKRRAGAAPRAAASSLSDHVRVTAVVLTRDRPALVLRAIDSLQANRTSPHTLVVDNNSAPAAAAALVEECAERDRVFLHRSDRNLRCAGGRLLGSTLAQGELVMFIDDDAELCPGALDVMVAELDAHPEAGAVTATVQRPDGVVHHSGGSLRVYGGVAEFSLIGADRAPEELPPSGHADWVPGTAVLIRRALLTEFPLDPQMTSAYYEDNEWCYRVALARPGCFRRSREAVAVHHLTPRLRPGRDFVARSAAIDLLRGHARFYERHRLLLGIGLSQLVPELCDAGGEWDQPAARLLMELVLAKGGDWVFMEWINGGLDVLLRARARLIEAGVKQEELERRLAWAESDLAAQRQAIAAQDEHVAALLIRHGQLVAIEQGGWWRLRGRMQPAVTLYRRVRGMRC